MSSSVGRSASSPASSWPSRAAQVVSRRSLSAAVLAADPMVLQRDLPQEVPQEIRVRDLSEGGQALPRRLLRRNRGDLPPIHDG
jgi:hypothetical protein